MNAVGLLTDLEARGCTVTPKEASVRVEAPAGVLTEEDREAIFEHADALLRLLRSRDASPTSEQVSRIRAYGRALGPGGPEWAARLLEPSVLTAEEAERLLAWLDRRAAQDERAEAVR